MVQFNPFFRISVEECLAHPYFNKVRNPTIEVKSNTILDIDLDKHEGEFSFSELKALLKEEILFFKRKREREGSQHVLLPTNAN